MDKQQISPSKPNQIIETDPQHHYKSKSYLRHYYHYLRWMVFIILFSLGLANCELARNLIVGITYNPTYIDFPLGRNKQINIDTRSYVKHRFCIYMRTEFIDGNIELYGPNLLPGKQGRNQQISDKQYAFIGAPFGENKSKFYTFKVTAYKQEWGQEKVFFIREYNNLNIRKTIAQLYGDNTKNPRNNAYQVGIECFSLPRGKYRFEFIDSSSFIPEFDKVITSVGVHPNNELK